MPNGNVQATSGAPPIRSIRTSTPALANRFTLSAYHIRTRNRRSVPNFTSPSIRACPPGERNRPALRNAEFGKVCVFRRQWHTFDRMRLRATCLLLLLLLVGLQSSGVACAVRCETMANLGSPSRMSGMANCQMASQSDPGHQEMAAYISSQSCAGHLCMNDWTFLQNQVVHDLSVASSPVVLAVHFVAPIPIASRLKFEANRSTRTIPPFDPLVSNLRV